MQAIHRITWANLKYYKLKKQIQKVYILWSIHVTFWKRENYRDINWWTGCLMAKWLTIKEVHRETFQGEKIILCGTGVVNTLVKTHKTINHKKGTLIMQIKKKKKTQINSRTEPRLWQMNLTLLQTNDVIALNMGTEGEQSILSKFGKLYFTRN